MRGEEMKDSPELGLGNRFLRALPRHVSKALAEHVTTVPLERGMVLVHAGTPTGHLYFPDRGLISLVKIMTDGRTAEVGCIGIDGLAGVSGLLGMEQAMFESMVQIPGSAQSIKTTVLRAELEGSPVLRELVLRWMHFYVDQLAQTAACNRLHSLKERCCRWLLIAHDNAREETFTLTHEFLALMMGVNRPSLTLAVAALQRRGLIEYKRASVSILDRRGLEDGACECYGALRRELDRIYNGSA
jgi:CRP-like cAMP-binding protein